MSYIRNMYGEIIADGGKGNPRRADPVGIANKVMLPSGKISNPKQLIRLATREKLEREDLDGETVEEIADHLKNEWFR
jgi:hypothetical protein